MENNKELIHSFYNAFSKGDLNTMIHCYHDDVSFTDPAFGTLKGNRVKNMWRMLFERRDANPIITFSNVKADANIGQAQWQATYSYGPKKRKVVNNVNATFKFKEGKIIEHIDDFNLWKWTRQALGLSGFLLGWSSFMRAKIQKRTNATLDEFIKNGKQ